MRGVRRTTVVEVVLKVGIVATTVVSVLSSAGLVLATGPVLAVGYVWAILRAGRFAAWAWLALSVAGLWAWMLAYTIAGERPAGWISWVVMIVWASFVSVLIPFGRRRPATP